MEHGSYTCKGTDNQPRGIQVVTSESGVGLSSAFGSLSIPYARVHNQGGTITHPARTRQMTFKIYKAGKHKGKTLFHKNNEKAYPIGQPRQCPVRFAA